MIALDTNVLVRYLVRDDAEQAEAARALLESLTADRPGYVSARLRSNASGCWNGPIAIPERGNVSSSRMNKVDTFPLLTR